MDKFDFYDYEKVEELKAQRAKKYMDYVRQWHVAKEKGNERAKEKAFKSMKKTQGARSKIQNDGKRSRTLLVVNLFFMSKELLMVRSWQYKPWEPWNYSDQKKSEMFHATCWKNESLWKKNRPLCGAKCRDGHLCRARAVVSQAGKPINGRCRMHGGLSTGAKTEEGKEKSKNAARRGMLAYWAKKKEFRL